METKINTPSSADYQLSTHSEEIDDIIGQAPHLLIRFGMVGFLTVIILFLIAAWIVKYPETVKGSCILYASNLPKPVIARSNGRLASLFVKEGDKVLVNQHLALIQSTADYTEVQKLEQRISELQTYVKNREWTKIFVSQTEFGSVGELQGSFQAFFSAYARLDMFIIKGLYVNKVNLIRKDWSANEALGSILQNQKAIYEKDYSIAESEYEMKNALYKQKVIAKSELKQEESKLLYKKIPLENLNTSLLNNKVATITKEKELLELDKQYNEILADFEQAINTLSNEIKVWKYQYLILSPTKGNVTFTEVVQESQEVTSGQELFYVEPRENGYTARVLVDQINLGKVREGQLVTIQLPSYPSQEYGFLDGKVDFISRLPNKDKQYVIKVSLPNGLTTNTGKKIHFLNELVADAEIVTQKERLLYKFLQSIIGIFSKKHQGPQS